MGNGHVALSIYNETKHDAVIIQCVVYYNRLVHDDQHWKWRCAKKGSAQICNIGSFSFPKFEKDYIPTWYTIDVFTLRMLYMTGMGLLNYNSGFVLLLF